MTSGIFLLFTVCASLLCLTSAKTTSVVVNKSWQPRSTFDGVLPDNEPIDDCPTQEADIIQAFSDALALAGNARDVIRGGFQSKWHLALFDLIFADKQGPFSRTKVGNFFDRIATNDGLPDEIIFHCGDGWREAMYKRRSAYGIKGTFSGCGTGTSGMTSRVKSGDFPPDMFSEFGPQGAFRSGVHITLCPLFFTLPNLSNLPSVAAGRLLDAQDTRAWTMIHELAHAADSSILDGGYGYGGCVDVANEVIAAGRANVNALKNADTYALFAISVTPTQSMNTWDWTKGYASAPAP